MNTTGRSYFAVGSSNVDTSPPVALRTWNNITFFSSVVLIVALSIIAGLEASPLVAAAGFDREVFRYGGMCIWKGGFPYVDFFDHKPPLIYALTALAHPLRPWGFWWLERLSVVAAVLALIIAFWRRSRFGACASSVCFVVLFHLPGIYEGGGLTRCFGACFALVALCVSVVEWRWSPFLAGVACGSVLLLQQEDAASLIVAVPILLFITRGKLPDLGSFVIGAGSVGLAVVIWLFLNGALSACIDQAFVFNVKHWVGGHANAGRTGPLIVRLRQVGLFRLLLLLIPLLVAATLAGRREMRIGGGVLAAILVQLAVTMATGRFFGHYFLPLAALVSFVLATTFRCLAVWGRHELNWWARIAMLGLVLWATPVEPFTKTIQIGLEALPHLRDYPTYTGINDELRPELEQVRGKPGQLMVWRNTKRLHLNTYFEIMSPSRWLYTHFWDVFPEFDTDGREFGGIISDVTRWNSRYVLDYSKGSPIRAPLQRQWDDFVMARYHQLRTLNDGGVLYERNGAECAATLIAINRRCHSGLCCCFEAR